MEATTNSGIPCGLNLVCVYALNDVDDAAAISVMTRLCRSAEHSRPVEPATAPAFQLSVSTCQVASRALQGRQWQPHLVSNPAPQAGLLCDLHQHHPMRTGLTDWISDVIVIIRSQPGPITFNNSTGVVFFFFVPLLFLEEKILQQWILSLMCIPAGER